jgi:uncharacterized protein YkwD
VHNRRLVAGAVAFAAALFVAAPSAAFAACDGADDVPSAASLDVARSTTLCLLNQERTSRGLRKLRSNGRLRDAAQGYSRQMVSRNFFDHVSPTGSTLVSRIKATNYLASANGWSLGENIAWGGGSRATPRETVDAWMNSAGHKRNILTGSFDEIGIGVVVGAPADLPEDMPSATYTTDFGTRG